MLTRIIQLDVKECNQPYWQDDKKAAREGKSVAHLHDIDMSLLNHEIDKSVTKVSSLLLRPRPFS
jgi:hypothetical protein